MTQIIKENGKTIIKTGQRIDTMKNLQGAGYDRIY